MAVARERILSALRTDGLHAASFAALDLGTVGRDAHSTGDGQARGDGTVGRRSHLSVHTLTAYSRGLVTVVPIRWLIDEVGDGQPLLDANLEIGPVETAETTLLLLVGVVRRIGSSTDQSLHQQDLRRAPRNLLATVAALLALSPTSKDAEHSA